MGAAIYTHSTTDKKELRKISSYTPRKRIKKKQFSYKDVKFDIGGWADSNEYLPFSYDLCYVKTEPEVKNLIAWHTGQIWDGLNMKSSYKVLCWKRFM